MMGVFDEFERAMTRERVKSEVWSAPRLRERCLAGPLSTRRSKEPPEEGGTDYVSD
jgi:hypothetical protein